jgi:hypothetical protein
LGEVRKPDDVGAPEERIEKHAHRERILEIVVLLDAGAADLEFGAAKGTVPDVPFVIGDIDRMARGLRFLRRLNEPLYDLDSAVDIGTRREEAFEIVLGISDVRVKRDVVDVILQCLEDCPVPADPVCARAEICGLKHILAGPKP